MFVIVESSVCRLRWRGTVLVAAMVALLGVGSVVSPARASAPGDLYLPGYMYWTVSGTNGLFESYTDGNDASEIASGAAFSDPGAVATDGVNVYWVNTGNDTIGEANLDGSDPQTLIAASTVVDPQGIAVAGNGIEWTNADNDTLGVAALDGSGASVYDGGVCGDEPAAMAVGGDQEDTFGDPAADVICYSTGTDESYLLNSGGGPQLLTTGPAALAIDSTAVYWTDAGNDTIYTANLDGTDARAIETTSAAPAGLALPTPYIYTASDDTGDPLTSLTFGSTPQQTLSLSQTIVIFNPARIQATIGRRA